MHLVVDGGALSLLGASFCTRFIVDHLHQRQRQCEVSFVGGVVGHANHQATLSSSTSSLSFSSTTLFLLMTWFSAPIRKGIFDGFPVLVGSVISIVSEVARGRQAALTRAFAQIS